MNAAPTVAQRWCTAHARAETNTVTNRYEQAELLSAIQALEALKTSSGETNSPNSAVLPRVLKAWAYFLELAASLDTDSQEESHRQHTLLVLESRVLGCVKRFLDHCASAHDSSVLSSCTGATRGGCVPAILKTCISCFLFLLSCQKSSALLIVRSRLHVWLLDECRSGSGESRVVEATTAIDTMIDSKDVLVGVDPFYWALIPLDTLLKHEGSTCDVYRLPIGPRSLSHLLRDGHLPHNETEELSIQLQRPKSPLESPMRSNPRRLPSIFQFTTRVKEDDVPPKPCFVCNPPQDDVSAWEAATAITTCQHFVIRAVVAMVLLLHPSSTEFKTLRRDGVCEALLQVVSCPSSQITNNGIRREDHETGSGPAGEQIKTHLNVIREIAIAGTKVLEPQRETASSEGIGGALGPKSPVKSMRPSPTTVPVSSPLKAKLDAISEQARRKRSHHRREELTRQHELERAELRQRVRDLHRSAMEMRDTLIKSLGVMSVGRPHPAAQSGQSITTWLESFMTIDKREQLRQEQEAMRQRRLIELQFQLEERRRRQRDERLMMAANDQDTPTTTEKSKEEAKREEYRRLQQEMQELRAKEEEEKRKATETSALERKRDAALLEARRQQALVDESRRLVKENELMRKEDTYYVEKILREKRQRELEAKQAKAIDPIAEQQKRIELMWKQDEERKRCEHEYEMMRNEDLLARQRRLIEAESRRKQAERERNERRQLEAEERWLKVQWKRSDDAIDRQRKDEERQRRAEDRRARREQEQQWKAWQAAWISLYDPSGNIYYYNQLTGESQWTNPFEMTTVATTTTGDETTTGAAASWPDTSSMQYQWY